MTDAEKLKMLKAMTGEADEEVLSTYLSIAGSTVSYTHLGGNPV